jgi:acyl-CoA thioester hydrolase
MGELKPRRGALELPIPEKRFWDVDVRVRYADTDQMGVAYHGSYMVWFEIGRTEFCRSKGFAYLDLEQTGYRLLITDLRCRYRKAVRYDDVITIRTWVGEFKKRMMTFGYRILCQKTGEIAASGETRHICLDILSGRPRTLPERFRQALNHS